MSSEATEQVRIRIDEIIPYLSERVDSYYMILLDFS